MPLAKRIIPRLDVDDGRVVKGVNSAAAVDPSLIARGAEAFGTQCIVVAIDAKRDSEEGSEEDAGEPRWQVFTSGGRNATGRGALDWAAGLPVRPPADDALSEDALAQDAPDEASSHA